MLSDLKIGFKMVTRLLPTLPVSPESLALGTSRLVRKLKPPGEAACECPSRQVQLTGRSTATQVSESSDDSNPPALEPFPPMSRGTETRCWWLSPAQITDS